MDNGFAWASDPAAVQAICHGLTQRIPRTHRYQVTATGLRDALLLTRACARLWHGGLAELAGPPLTHSPKLRAAARAYETAIDDLLTRAGLAASTTPGQAPQT